MASRGGRLNIRRSASRASLGEVCESRHGALGAWSGTLFATSLGDGAIAAGLEVDTVDYQATFEINATPDRVWEVLMEIERWPEWTASMQSATKLDAGDLRVGTRVEVRQPKVPPITWTVSELVAGRSFAWVADARGIHSVASHEVESTATGSRVTLSVHQTGFGAVLMGWYLKRLSARYVPMEGAGLKARAEAKAAVA